MTKPPSCLVQGTLFPAPPVPVPGVSHSSGPDSMTAVTKLARHAGIADVPGQVSKVFSGAKNERPGTEELTAGYSAFYGLALPSVGEEQRRAVARAAYGRCVCGGVACGKSHQNWRDMGRCGSTETDARLFAVPVALVGITGEPGELVAFCGGCLARVAKRIAAEQPVPAAQQELVLLDGDGTGA